MPDRPSPLASALVRGAGLAILAACLCSSPSMAQSQSSPPDNPLPACPDTPNCERTSRPFGSGVDAVFDAVQTALTEMGPSRLDVTPETHRAHAVFRVALLFQDDVDVAVTGDDGAATVHVRSASRVGYSDFGVNARRVRRFFDAVDRALPSR